MFYATMSIGHLRAYCALDTVSITMDVTDIIPAFAKLIIE